MERKNRLCVGKEGNLDGKTGIYEVNNPAGLSIQFHNVNFRILLQITV